VTKVVVSLRSGFYYNCQDSFTLAHFSHFSSLVTFF